jgi:hypothetical protein
MNKMAKFILFSISVYLIWVFATYMLEGRVNLLQRVDPIGRMEYAVIANILIGTVFGFIMLKPSLKSRFVTQKQLGFQSPRRIIILVAAAASVGFILFFTGNPASFNPVVITNAFSQTLPTSIAEVVICWIVVGTAFEALVKRTKKSNDNDVAKVSRIPSIRTASVLAILVGAAVSIVLFGIYHFMHSSPFNQPTMVLFLMIPAILTSMFYFVGREIYSTITIHNFLALIGVMGSIDIIPLSQPIYPVIIIAWVSVLVLIASDLFLIRRMKLNYEPQWKLG